MTSHINIFSNSSALLPFLTNYFNNKGFSLSSKNFKEDLSNSDLKPLTNYSIFIFDQLTDSNLKEYENLMEKVMTIANGSYKSLFIFPYTNTYEITEKVKYFQNKILSSGDFVSGIIFLGDPVLNNRPISFGLLEKYINTSNVSNLFPADVEWLVLEIGRLVFSLKAYGQSTALIGPPLTLNNENVDKKNIVTTFNPTYDQIKICPQTISLNIPEPKEISEKKTIPPLDTKENFKESLDGTSKSIPIEAKDHGLNINKNKPPTTSLSEYSTTSSSIIEHSIFRKFLKQFSSPQVPSLPVSSNNYSSIQENHTAYSEDELNADMSSSFKRKTRFLMRGGFHKKWLMTLLIVVVLSLLVPFASYFTSLNLFRFSNTKYLSTNPYLNKTLIRSSEVLVNISFATSEKFNWIRLKNNSQKLRDAVLINKQLNFANLEALSLIKVIINNQTDFANNSQQFITSLDYLNVSTGFLQTDLEVQKLFGPENLFNKTQIEKTKNIFKNTKSILEELPNILGQEESRKYVVVVNDSNEPKGSGGAILNLAIVEVSGLNIINVTIYEPSMLDKALKGKIEAPSDYVELLNKENLSIVDAHWYSDFSLTASFISRLLNDSLGIEVSGLMSINSDSLSNFSNYDEGNIQDINIKIEGNPKQSGELIKTINVLTNTENYDDNKILYSLFGALQKKDIQVYFENSKVNESVSNLELGGRINAPKCNNCFADLTSILEIPLSQGGQNIGQNIQREVDLNIFFEEGIIKKRLTVYIKNNNEHEYESIFRILTPDNSGFAPTNIVTKDSKTVINSFVSTVDGFKENSVKTKFSSNNNVGISFSWEQPVDNIKNYNNYVLKIIKQPGDFDYNLSINISFPPNIKVEIPNGYFLTNDGLISYNAKLESDLITDIKFIK